MAEPRSGPPLLLLARLERRGQAFPLISLLTVFTNGIWWILFDYFDAFTWATIFHGLAVPGARASCS